MCDTDVRTKWSLGTRLEVISLSQSQTLLLLSVQPSDGSWLHKILVSITDESWLKCVLHVGWLGVHRPGFYRKHWFIMYSHAIWYLFRLLLWANSPYLTSFLFTYGTEASACPFWWTWQHCVEYIHMYICTSWLVNWSVHESVHVQCILSSMYLSKPVPCFLKLL